MDFTKVSVFSKDEKETLRKFAEIADTLSDKICDSFDCCEDCPLDGICSQYNPEIFEEEVNKIVREMQSKQTLGE